MKKFCNDGVMLFIKAFSLGPQKGAFLPTSWRLELKLFLIPSNIFVKRRYRLFYRFG